MRWRSGAECHCARRNSVQFATDFRGNNIQVAVALSGHHARNTVRSRLSGSSHVENRRRAEAAHPRGGRRDRAPSSAQKKTARISSGVEGLLITTACSQCRRRKLQGLRGTHILSYAGQLRQGRTGPSCREPLRIPDYPLLRELPMLYRERRAPRRLHGRQQYYPLCGRKDWPLANLTHHSFDYQRELFPHAPGMSACRRARSFDTYNMHSACSGMQASEELSIAAPIGILLLSNTVICA